MPSRIEAGLTLEGSVRGEGELVVAGRLRGVLTLAGTLVVEEGGAVEAEVECDRAIVAGLLSGSIQAHEELRIEAGGHVDARVRANRLAVADGAVFRGELSAPQASVNATYEARSLRAGRAAPSLAARPESPRMGAPPVPTLEPVEPRRPAIGAPPVPPAAPAPAAPASASRAAPRGLGFAAPAQKPQADAMGELPTRRPPPMATPAVRPAGPPKMPGLPRGRTVMGGRGA